MRGRIYCQKVQGGGNCVSFGEISGGKWERRECILEYSRKLSYKTCGLMDIKDEENGMLRTVPKFLAQEI